MSCTQANICLPSLGLFFKGPNSRLRRTYSPPSQSRLHVSSVYASATNSFQHCKAFPRLVYNASKYRRCAPVCVHDGKGNAKNENWAFPWNPLKNVMGGLRQEQSLEGLLRKQMEEREFNGGGGGKIPPEGGGGDGSGGSEDGDFAGIFDELLQVICATIAFIFVYIYFIRGEELTRLARDYIKYLFGAKTSVRLRRAMHKWRKFYESITWQEPREDWLERAIITRPTWWNNPRKLDRWMRSDIES